MIYEAVEYLDEEDLSSEAQLLQQDPSSSFQQALLARIEVLEQEILKEKETTQKLRRELAETKKGIARFLGTDQLKAIKGGKVKKWSTATVKKALLVKTKGGTQLLDYVRQFIVPLPSAKVIRSRLSSFKVKPGIIDMNLKSLKEETKDFVDRQKHFVLIYDEKAIIPGIQNDQASGEKVGFTTLPKSSELAVNAMVLLVAGVEIRLKRAIGLHFMGRKVDPSLVHQFLIDVIFEFEDKTGCFIDAIVFDLGPHNIAVLNAFGLAVAKGKNENFVVHPVDPSRKLYMIRL